MTLTKPLNLIVLLSFHETLYCYLSLVQCRCYHCVEIDYSFKDFSTFTLLIYFMLTPMPPLINSKVLSLHSNMVAFSLFLFYRMPVNLSTIATTPTLYLRKLSFNNTVSVKLFYTVIKSCIIVLLKVFDFIITTLKICKW